VIGITALLSVRLWRRRRRRGRLGAQYSVVPSGLWSAWIRLAKFSLREMSKRGRDNVTANGPQARSGVTLSGVDPSLSLLPRRIRGTAIKHSTPTPFPTAWIHATPRHDAPS
jgi:hypothetical protein